MKYEPISSDLGCTRGNPVRAEVTLLCEVRQGSQAWKSARLEDISQAGFKIAWLPAARNDVPMRIRIPGLQVLTAHIRWQQDSAIGCEFAEPLHIAVFEHIVRQCAAG